VTAPSALKNDREIEANPVRMRQQLLYDKLNHRTRMISHLENSLPPLKLYLDDIEVIITLFARLHPIEYIYADKEIFDTVAQLSKKQQRNFRELSIHSTDNTTLRIRTRGSIKIFRTGSPTGPELLLDGDPDALREINTYLAKRTHYLLYVLPATVEVLRFCSFLTLVIALNASLKFFPHLNFPLPSNQMILFGLLASFILFACAKGLKFVLFNYFVIIPKYRVL